MITSETMNGVCRVRISADMTMYTAIEACDLLRETLLLYKEIEIDLAGVTDIDSAGLQLLIQVKRQGAKTGVLVRMACHSPAVQEIVDLYRLTSEFGDPMAMSPG